VNPLGRAAHAVPSLRQPAAFPAKESSTLPQPSSAVAAISELDVARYEVDYNSLVRLPSGKLGPPLVPPWKKNFSTPPFDHPSTALPASRLAGRFSAGQSPLKLSSDSNLLVPFFLKAEFESFAFSYHFSLPLAHASRFRQHKICSPEWVVPQHQ